MGFDSDFFICYKRVNRQAGEGMERLGIITGTLTLREKVFLETTEKKSVENEYGKALVYLGRDVVLVPRHGEAGKYVLPHLINHPANMKALKDLGVEEVIAVNSTGSLKKNLAPGMIVLPDDFIFLAGGPTVFREEAVHITPDLSPKVRLRLVKAAADAGVTVIDKGVYWQTIGPRLETKAEIRMMAGYADVVGMTMASEAVVAKELGMEYASLCSVDNYAHGVEERELSMEQILRQSRENAESVSRVVSKYVERRRG
ncbi:MAG: MTAP family purine nucleoside phosphorylase [Syntrophobacterales bacterium]|nr:MTAP family purine nucleoside phosphorylase [Syntrophobacterales bacterium]